MRFKRKCNKCIVLTTIASALTFYVLLYKFQDYDLWNLKNAPHQWDIDCVYTWVNGSDERFQAKLKQYHLNIDNSRYDDKNELRYSLRSLEQHAAWIRNVYIVTNGQIPHWLDLDNPRVQVIAHNQLCVGNECELLPTFSSSAIETWIHRIPGLSKQFLYMNDDIYLGAPLYPDDLITQTSGVKVFTAWSIPDCASDCPWVYIGDGSCDPHCNNEKCQFDGGDCDLQEDVHALPSGSDEFESLMARKMLSNGTVPLRRPPNFSELLRQKQQQLNGTNPMKKFVSQFNDALQKAKVKPKKEKTLPESQINDNNDEFAQTLVATNRILNLAYGFHHNRKVLAHVGFLVDRDIVEAMQEKFADEIRKTRSRRTRSGDDLQFALAYYNFLMSEKVNLTVGEIFDEFDTDRSGSWSDREIRTLLTKVYNLPLDWSAVRYFENVVTNCSLANYWRHNGMHQPDAQIALSTLVYERYEDSNIPQVTKQLVLDCAELADMLAMNFATRPRYKFHVHPKTASDSNFKMLTTNVTYVVDILDQIRRQPKKFNCINDNLSNDDSLDEDNQLIRALLEDFYLSFFPRPSQFELAFNYRNRFRYLHDYHRWTRRRWWLERLCYFLGAVAMIGGFRMMCRRHRAKFASKFVNGIFN